VLRWRRLDIPWARAFWGAMQPFSTSGVYVNYLGQEADEGAERVQAAGLWASEVCAAGRLEEQVRSD
jgi:hypothetical protein